MLTRLFSCLIAIAALPFAVAADEPKKSVDSPLKRARLEQLEGVWEMVVDSPTGWKGTLRAEVKLFDPKGEQPDGGSITYSYDLRRGAESKKVNGTPSPPVWFVGLQRGDAVYLLLLDRDMDVSPIPVPSKPEDSILVRFEMSKATLKLTAGKSFRRLFVTDDLTPLKLDWDKLRWERAKKK